jgi:hypothetical protein
MQFRLILQIINEIILNMQQKMPKKKLYSNSYKDTILLFCPEQLKSKHRPSYNYL